MAVDDLLSGLMRDGKRLKEHYIYSHWMLAHPKAWYGREKGIPPRWKIRRDFLRARLWWWWLGVLARVSRRDVSEVCEEKREEG